MSKPPTQEQIREFWEWCEYTGKLDYIEDIGEEEGKLVYKFPPIDLNNLFKYAMPKLMREGCLGVDKRLEEWVCDLTGDYEKDTLALFWTLWQIKEVKDEVPKLQEIPLP